MDKNKVKQDMLEAFSDVIKPGRIHSLVELSAFMADCLSELPTPARQYALTSMLRSIKGGSVEAFNITIIQIKREGNLATQAAMIAEVATFLWENRISLKEDNHITTSE